MQSVTVGTLRLFGGHTALDFTNTVNSRGAVPGGDVLQAYGDLLDWGVRVGVLGAEEAAALRDVAGAVGDAALFRAKALREALYRTFSGASAGRDDLAVLERGVWAAQGARHLVRGADDYMWCWMSGDPDTVSHRMAVAGVDLLISPAISRVRVCPGDDCGWLFLDSSRAGRRVWCSDETCGTRHRVRRWRSRLDPLAPKRQTRA